MSRYNDPVTYIQHNPRIGDGSAAMVAAFRKLDAAGTPHRYLCTPILLDEGNFILVASEGLVADVPTVYYDLSRLSDGRIVEHWDVLQTIPPQTEWKNGNGKF
ncbi:Predicted SnoaL-like aldol condensation-catalyzing enzyme [Sphingobium sp. AP50]|uniref:nuclear transport factor 2 family protein n=1 Tax=Sphingobium sp. AP50 TaxID=1884369 RepID=UPI0008D214D8|nr:hypothetical protein [Sphingobium sp. AP50]SEJ90342.1 Predicted SnoaL-like aldol condensation-catalyzing enzyme [Sphingobium sp. AP50]